MKEVQGYSDYLISKDGKVWSVRKNKFLAIDYLNGYSRCKLFKNKKGKNFFIHRLVALAYIDNPENKKEVNHINLIKTDNRMQNLEWVTAKENTRHYIKNGYIKHLRNNKRVLNKETYCIYESATSAAKALGYSKSYVSSMLRGESINKTPLVYL